MRKVILKNFRTFQSPAPAELGRITVLLGENSTGKSTFLAAIRLAWDAAQASNSLDFNEEPFNLGSFDQIAHFRGGKAGRAKNFSLALQTEFRKPERNRRTEGQIISVSQSFDFVRDGSHPFLECQRFEGPNISLSARVDVSTKSLRFHYSAPHRDFEADFKGSQLPPSRASGGLIDWQFLMYRSQAVLPELRREATFMEDTYQVDQLVGATRRAQGRRPIAMSPIRSKPLRTYHPTSELPTPDGGHVPLVLAKIFASQRDRWERLAGLLSDFGKASGLFKRLEIKLLGKHESDPFQVQVRMGGPAFNIVDVGYGVSQILPIIVDPLLSSKGNLFLLQQPEVHLHPRGQAELASFVARVSKEFGVRFVIETHSDYFVNRLRVEAKAASVIRHDDLSLLYFERTGLNTEILPLPLDERGNFRVVPEGYRTFFLEEDLRVLGMS